MPAPPPPRSAPPALPCRGEQLSGEAGPGRAASPRGVAGLVYAQPVPLERGECGGAVGHGRGFGLASSAGPPRARGRAGRPPPGSWPSPSVRRSRAGWGAELGRAAVAYAGSVALDRLLRTTVPEWNAVGLRVAEQSGFVRSGTLALGGRRYIILEQPGT